MSAADGTNRISETPPKAALTDEERIRRADEALGDLSKGYRQIAQAALAEARQYLAVVKRGGEPGETRQALRELYRVMHDLKGQGASLGYTLVSDIGQLMCRLLRGCGEAPGASTVEVGEAQLAALERVLEHDIRGGGGEGGRRLLARLAELVEQVAPPAPPARS